MTCEEKLKMACDALEKYADKDNWQLFTHYSIMPREWVRYDQSGYDVAREALAQINATTTQESPNAS